MVSDYRSGGKPHEAVENLVLAREWMKVSNEFLTSFKTLRPLAGAEGAARAELEGTSSLTNLISRFESSVPYADAKKELIALRDQAQKNSEAFIRVDLQCLARFNQRLIDLIQTSDRFGRLLYRKEC